LDCGWLFSNNRIVAAFSDSSAKGFEASEKGQWMRESKRGVKETGKVLGEIASENVRY